MIFVAFYTVNSPYEAQIERLSYSLKPFGFPFMAKGTPHRGSWYQNVLQKAAFCQEMLQEFGQKAPVVYLDADAEIRRDPEPIGKIVDADLAMTWNRTFHWWRSNLIAMWPSDATRETLALWVDLSARAALADRCFGHHDQDILNVVCMLVAGLKIHELDANLFAMTQFRDKACGPKGPIIFQHQAARQLKEVMDKK